jgi:hypothetical protein
MRSTGLILVVSLFILLWSGCRDRDRVVQDDEGRLLAGEVEVEDTFERSFAPGTRHLVIEGYTGLLELTGTTGTDASLTFTRRARAANESTANDRLRNVTIQESGDQDAYRIMMAADRPHVTSVDVRGEVPAGVALRVVLTNGSITITDVTGPIVVENQNGHVRLVRAGSDVEVETRNGTVEATFARVPADATIRLLTINGDVVIELPAGTDAGIRASTAAGPIHAEGLDFTQRRLEPTAAGNRFTGRLGRGGASIQLETQNGGVHMRSSQPAPGAPPVEMPEATGPPPATNEEG